MATKRGMMSLAAGLMLGLLAGWLVFGQGPIVEAAGNSDRNGDFVICTGPIVQNFTNTNFGFELDGVWLLDYRSGKLMASAVNRLDGKMQAWTEVDLVKEFGIAPRSNAHFVMTTGLIAKGQAALYLAETSTGKMGIYSMALTDEMTQVGLNSAVGASMTIRRHDMTNFRGPQAKGGEAPAK